MSKYYAIRVYGHGPTLDRYWTGFSAPDAWSDDPELAIKFYDHESARNAMRFMKRVVAHPSGIYVWEVSR